MSNRVYYNVARARARADRLFFRYLFSHRVRLIFTSLFKTYCCKVLQNRTGDFTK